MQKATFALVDDGRVEVSYPNGSSNLDIAVTDVGDGYEVKSADLDAVLLAAFPKGRVLYWFSDQASAVHA